MVQNKNCAVKSEELIDSEISVTKFLSFPQEPLFAFTGKVDSVGDDFAAELERHNGHPRQFSMWS